MPAQVLRLIEPQENIEQLKAQLRAELDECVEVDTTPRNSLFKFMVENQIWHIEDLDYFTRQKYEESLRERLTEGAAKTYLKAHDKVKLHVIKKRGQIVINGESIAPPYKNMLLFLPYHPNPEVAERFQKSYSIQDMVWDFRRNTSEKLKR